jgi:hypothetical protein
MSNLKQEPIQTQPSFQIFFKNYLSKAYSPKDNQTNFVVNPYFHIASTISIIIHNPTTILNKNPLHFQSTNKKKKTSPFQIELPPLFLGTIIPIRTRLTLLRLPLLCHNHIPPPPTTATTTRAKQQPLLLVL